MQKKRRNLLQTDNAGDNNDQECRPFNMEIEKRVLERLSFYLGNLISTNLFISNFISNGGFTIATTSTSTSRSNEQQQQDFPPLLSATHRDQYLALAYSLPQTTLVYFGLEDGTCIGNYWDYGYYREPGNSGYYIIVNNNTNDDNATTTTTTNTTVNPNMQKHWKSCVNSTTGESIGCVLPPGDLYIQCSHNNESTSSAADAITEQELYEEAASGLCNTIELCPDAASQRDCSPLLQQNDTNTTTTNKNNEYQTCMAAKKWCRQYTIETASAATSENNNNNTRIMGMLPLTNYCLDKHGQFTQTMGKVYTPLHDPDNNNCYYLNGQTLVQRHNISGDYAYCQRQQSHSSNDACMAENNNATLVSQTMRLVCNDTFIGGYESNNYDPRYRPWYINTKQLQVPNWSLYPFFALGLGITYSYPIYQTTFITNTSSTNDENTKQEEEKQVFAGVLAIDYRIEDIAQFLVESYGNTTTSVVIYEDATPNYVIGTSTGSLVVKQMLTSNLSLPCPVESFTNNVQECTPVRLSVLDMSSHYMDVVQSRAFVKHQALNYPQELLSVNGPSSSPGRGDAGDLYISQSTLFEQEGTHGLKWRVLITSPAKRSHSDAITVENNPSFLATICTIAGLGFAICAVFAYVLYNKRTERAMIVADWRFTCAFILGCALLNVATFTLLGRNTDAMCLLRMWSFHVCFVMALAPLFVKVWRIRELVGRTQIRRTTINNTRAALYTLPMICIQVVILLVITFMDPPKPTEVIENTGSGVMVQSIVCDTDTNALLIVQMLFEGGLILVGCILAYRSRNMNSEFGEAKQLIFAMYNIALVGIIAFLVVTVADVDPNGQSVFAALGIFWGTVFSSSAFVLPRMIQVRQAQRESLERGTPTNGPRFHVSGIDVSGRERITTSRAGEASMTKTAPAPATSNHTTKSLVPIKATSKSPGPAVDVTVPTSTDGNNDQVRVGRWEAAADIKEEKGDNMDSC